MLSVEQATDIKKQINNNILVDNQDVVALLTFADDNYYNGTSVEAVYLSDEEYDSIRLMLQKTDPTNAYFLGIGSSIRGGKVKLPYQMGSLDQIYSGDIDKFITNNNLKQHTAVLSHKLDGNSAMAIWDNTGKFQIGYSRGDGVEGADISRHLSQMPTVPKQIEYNLPLVVRGENIINTKLFPSVQKIVSSRSGKPYKNARNAVSGLMNASENNPVVYQYIEFVAYEIVGSDLSKTEQLDLLATLGFQIAKYETYNFKDLTDDNLTNILQIAKTETEYEIDGLVIDVDSAEKRAEMNPTRDTLNPAYSVKFKLTDEANIVTTKVVDVEINVSKDGYLKPRVNIEPVDILGATIQWATGFNMKFIFDNRLQPGSEIKICRSGDVIPYIHSVTPSTVSIDEFSEWFTSKVDEIGECNWTETGVDLVLDDALSNDTARFERLLGFFESLGVNNLGEGNLQKIFDAGFDLPEQVLMLTLEDICILVNSKPIGKKIFSSLREKLTNVPMYKLMGAHPAFGRGVGVRKMKKLYEAFEGNMSKCKNVVAITSVDGFDSKTATKISNGYPIFQAFLNYVESVVTIQLYVAPTIGSLSGKIFVFTGFRSPTLEREVEKLGGKMGSSVSSKTHYVVTENPNGSSGKLDKARSLGIPVIGVDELKEMIV